MEIHLPESKGDVYREGDYVVIATSSTDLCPVESVEMNLALTRITHPSDYLFRAITKTKTHQYLRVANIPLSYSTARTLILSALTKIGLDKSLFGVHSMRPGGASAAANNGVPDGFLKRHGMWRSERAKDDYIKDTSDRLSVSQI